MRRREALAKPRIADSFLGVAAQRIESECMQAQLKLSSLTGSQQGRVSCGAQASFAVGFVVRKNDTEIGYREVFICLRTRQARDQISDYVKTRGVFIVGANHDPGR